MNPNKPMPPEIAALVPTIREHYEVGYPSSC
jgi:hypothetical protein